jgi:DNA polymerase-3 subunit alpha (Gram-positive type)
MNEIQFYDYIFISPKHCLKHEVDKGTLTNDDIESLIKRIVNFSTKLDKKIIATANVYYLYKEMQNSHAVLIHNKLLGGKLHRFLVRDKLNVTPPLFYFMTTDEMKQEFSYLNDEKLIDTIVVENTYDFKNKFELNKILIKGLFTPKIEGVDDKLSNLVETTLKNCYGEEINPIIRERIEKELSIIIGKGYAVIYWISHLLVKKSNENGYVVGSRGSVGSSFIAFLAKISDVNALPPHYICEKCKHHEFYDDISVDGFDLPIKKCPICGEIMKSDGHNIPFESFLGTVGAPKVPDIDLNFSGEYQDEARRFINNMFGSVNAFRAGTVMTLAEKTAFGLVKKYFEEVDIEKVNNNAEIYYLQKDIIDGKRTNGLHAGGTIVVPSNYDIHDFCPYSLQPNSEESDAESNEYTTHFDFHAIHDNLLKFDILGHDIPTIFKLLRDSSGIDVSKVNFQDPKVLELFSGLEPLKIKPEDINGETIGTYALPECATNFTIGMIKESKPKSFGDLIRISGLSHGTDV